MKTINTNNRTIEVPETKQELAEWIDTRDRLGEGFWEVTHGGGLSFIGCGYVDIPAFIEDILSDEYCEKVDVLQKGKEYEDFKADDPANGINDDEYANTDCFILVHHDTQPNGENFDIQVQYWYD